MIKLNKVHHIAIICSNYQRSVEFYTRVLGFHVIAEHYRTERQSYKTDLALGDDYIIELFSFPSPPPRMTRPEAAGLRHLAFEVDDVAKAATEFDEMGCPTRSGQNRRIYQPTLFLLPRPRRTSYRVV